MGSPWSAAVTTAAGVMAAWCAARFPSFGPLLWVTILLLSLACRPAERRILDGRWLLAGAVLLGASWLIAADHELAMRHSLLFVAAAFLFGLVRLSPPGERLLGLLSAGIALTSLVAIRQAAGGLAGARDAVATLPPGWQEAALARIGGGRAFGTAALPGHFSALLMLAVPLLAERAWRSRGWLRVAWAGGLVLAAGAIVLTRSLAAVAIGCAMVLPFLLRNRSSRLAAAGAAALVAVVAAVAALRSDLGTLEPLRLRAVNWLSALWVFARNPWLGVGSGGVGQAALAGPMGAANATPYAHNTPLQLLAEFGVMGAIALAAGLAWLLRLVRRGWPSHKALTLAVASLPLHNLVDFSAYSPEVLLPWIVLTGALAARVSEPPTRALRAWAIVAFLGTGTVLGALAWRSESSLAAASGATSSKAVAAALEAARWAPWSVTPLEIAAGRALGDPAAHGVLPEIDRRLAARAWVQPRSAAWAEARSRVLLAATRPGEALVWAREARRRAPWRQDLAGLEAACSLRR